MYLSSVINKTFISQWWQIREQEREYVKRFRSQIIIITANRSCGFLLIHTYHFAKYLIVFVEASLLRSFPNKQFRFSLYLRHLRRQMENITYVKRKIYKAKILESVNQIRVEVLDS